MTSHSREIPRNQTTLDSWKEIAAYLQRDVSTAIRWEKSEELPVHRHQHSSRASVYAFPRELDAWKAARKPQPGESRPWRRWVPALAGGLALLAVAAFIQWGPIMNPPAPLAEAANVRGDVSLRQVWAGPDVGGIGSVSPDGRYLSFVNWDTEDLALRDLMAGESRLLTNKGGWAESEEFATDFSVISPDARQVVYGWHNEDYFIDLRVIGVKGVSGGEQPRILYSNRELSFVAPLAWFPDGRRVLTRFVRKDRTAQIVIFDTRDESVKVLRTVNWRWPGKTVLSPDGRYILYDAPVGKGQNAPHDIFLLAADGSSEIPLVAHPANDEVLGWTPDGAAVLFASDRGGRRGAWLLPIADGKAQGEASILRSNLDAGTALGFSTDGSFFYERQTRMMDVYTVSLDFEEGKVAGRPERVAQRFVGSNRAPDWSPDGKYLAYISLRGEAAAGSRTLVIRSMQTGEERDLTLDMGYFARPRWAPDGRSFILASRGLRAVWGIFRVDANTGKLTMVVSPQEDTAYLSPQLTPDGRTLFYTAHNNRERLAMIRARNLESGEERVVYRSENTWPRFDLSPAADRLAVIEQDRETQSDVLRLLSAEGETPRELLRLQFPEFMGNLPVWTADGKSILIWRGGRNSRPELWNVPVDGSPPQRTGLTSNNHTAVSVHPDGRQIAFTAGDVSREVWVMENFLPELKAAK